MTKTLNTAETAATAAGLTTTKVGRAAAESWAATLTEHFGVASVRTILLMRRTTKIYGRYEASSKRIILNTRNGGNTLKTLAPKIAHHICCENGMPVDCNAHGDEFARIFATAVKIMSA